MDNDKRNDRRTEIVEVDTVEEIDPTRSRATGGADGKKPESGSNPAEFGATPNPVAERAMVEKEKGGGLPNMGPESVPSSGMDRDATDPMGSDWDESNP